MRIQDIVNAQAITALAKKRFQEERATDHLEGWFLAKEIQRECDSKFRDDPDCVRIAILGMKKQFDLVISGINKGPNLGADIHYSGTVGACFEGAMLGVKSLALSAAFDDFSNAVKNLGRVYDEVNRRNMFAHTDILNVNFPAAGEEILITKMGPAIYSDDFDFMPDGTAVPRLVCLYEGTADLTLDTDAVMTGHISVTPIRCDLTDHPAFEKIKR